MTLYVWVFTFLYRESYEIGRGCANVGAVKQARTLRLLANAFLEWDRKTYWQKALNAIGQLMDISINQ